jgi:heptosyltransferase-2
MTFQTIAPLLRVFLCLLPRPSALRLGRYAGILVYVLDRKRRRAAKANLVHTLAAGDSYSRVARLARQSFAYLGTRAVESFRVERYHRTDRSFHFVVRGKANLKEAFARGKGVIFLTSQLGYPELVGVALKAAGYEPTHVEVLGGEAPLREMSGRVRCQARQVVAQSQEAKGDLVARLQKNAALCIALDRVGDADQAYVEFLGRPAAANTFPAELALAADAAVVPTFVLLDEYGRYGLTCDKPVNLTKTSEPLADVLSNVSSFCGAVAREVKMHPFQWPWVYDRWKPPQNELIRKPFRNVKRILIRMPNWLGDVVMSLPAARYIRRLFPHAWIACLIRENMAEIPRGSGDFDAVFGYEHKSGMRAIFQKAEMIRSLRRAFFDLAVVFTNSFESALWVYAAAIPLRVGYKADARGFLLTHALRRRPEPIHQIREYLRLCHYLGKAEVAEAPQVRISPSDQRWAEDFLRSIGLFPECLLVGFCPGAAYGPAKMWLGGRLIELARRLAEAYSARFLILGGKNDLQACSTVADGVGPDAMDLCGKTTIRELAALLSRCSLVVANDSGPLHFAAAIGIPTIGIFGPTDPQRSAPPANCTVIRKSVQCSPCYKRECPTDLLCMTSVSVEEVYREAAAILASRGAGFSQATTRDELL